MKNEMNDFSQRCKALSRRLNDKDFLINKGLGNEAAIFTFCYDPKLELQARSYFKNLEEDSQRGRLGTGELKVNLKVCNLYDIFLGICEERKILDKLPLQEEKYGKEILLKKIKRIASPEAFVKAMDWEPHETGDVLVITGVGEVYPFVRVHNILNHMQSSFRDVPIIVVYPGKYDGGSLTLFGKLQDGNYYRAFDLI